MEFPSPERTRLRQAFGKLFAISDPALIECVVVIHCERFSEVSVYEKNELYTGMPEDIEDLAGSGHRLFVGSRLRRIGVYAQRIIEHFGLEHPFVAVYGARHREPGRANPSCWLGSPGKRVSSEVSR